MATFFASASFFCLKAPLGVLSFFLESCRLGFILLWIFCLIDAQKRQRRVHAKKTRRYFVLLRVHCAFCPIIAILSKKTRTKDGPVVGALCVGPSLARCFCCRWKIPALVACLFSHGVFFASIVLFLFVCGSRANPNKKGVLMLPKKCADPSERTRSTMAMRFFKKKKKGL